MATGGGGGGADMATGGSADMAPDCTAKTFAITNSGASSYIINGSNDPELTLCRGTTYTFNISAAGHPFAIKTTQTTGNGDLVTAGITGANPVNGSGTITFVPGSGTPNTLFYICTIHSAMTGKINIVN
jgi:hypothetical protein